MLRMILVLALIFALLEGQTITAWTSIPISHHGVSTRTSKILASSNEDNPIQNEESISSPIEKDVLMEEAPPPLPQPSQMSPTNVMRTMGTNPRRIAISFLSASGIALAGNFLGVTSKLLMAVPEDTVASTGLDMYFPRGTYRTTMERFGENSRVFAVEN
jgi:hypothetical protein